MNEQKKNTMLNLPVQSQECFPILLKSFFQAQCQQNTSSTPPLRPAYPPESFYKIHLFTKVFARKLNKHSCTMERGEGYVTDNRHAMGSNATIFMALNLNTQHPYMLVQTHTRRYLQHRHAERVAPYLCVCEDQRKSPKANRWQKVIFLTNQVNKKSI